MLFKDKYPFTTGSSTELENNEHILFVPSLATPMVDVNSNQLTTHLPSSVNSLPLPSITEEMPLPMVEEIESEEESSAQEFDGVVITHDDDLNAGDGILNPDDGDGYDQDMEVHYTPMTEELFRCGHRHKIKSTIIKDFVANTLHETPCYQIEEFVSCDQFSENYRCYLAAVINHEIPQHCSRAVIGIV